jgi:UDP-N-acetylglucosamine 3-dehydrogenase
MKIGILGTGFGAYHAELYSKMEGIEEIFVYGRNPDKLKELEKTASTCYRQRGGFTG